MPLPPVASYIHEPLDIHGHFPAKISLNLVVVLNLPAEFLGLFLGEVLHPGVRIHTGNLKDLLRSRKAYSENIGQRDLNTLFSWYVNSGDSGHGLPYLLAPCLCLWRGFLLQMIRTTPLRRITRQNSHIGLTDGFTFMRVTLLW